MAARSIWNGTLHLKGAPEIPVKLYSAVEDRQVRFHLLHDKDKARVQQMLVDPQTGEEVERTAVRRGYQVERGTFVVLEDDELEALEPEPSKDIEVLRFVPPSSVSPASYDRAYYLGPAGDTAKYFALAAALTERERIGIARWTMRKREHVGALAVRGEHLVLVALHAKGEVVEVSSLAPPAGAAPTKKELAMAEQLVALLVEKFDPRAFRDEYRERVEALIEAKSRGKVYRFEPERRKPRAADLAHALERSLAQAKKSGDREDRRKERKSA